MEKNEFLGKGWGFPPEFHVQTKSIEMSDYEKDIQESLWILLSTDPGERIMLPDYGCGLKQMIFKPLDNSLLNYIKDIIKIAILHFEPRITLNQIHIEDQVALEGQVLIHLYYTIRKTNVRTNMVYPFYIKEGTNIKFEK